MNSENKFDYFVNSRKQLGLNLTMVIKVSVILIVKFTKEITHISEPLTVTTNTNVTGVSWFFITVCVFTQCGKVFHTHSSVYVITQDWVVMVCRRCLYVVRSFSTSQSFLNLTFPIFNLPSWPPSVCPTQSDLWADSLSMKLPLAARNRHWRTGDWWQNQESESVQ